MLMTRLRLQVFAPFFYACANGRGLFFEYFDL
jgi:hypothetical protein